MTKTKLYYLFLAVMWWLPGQVERRKNMDETMTVGQLRKYIKNLPADTPVFMVTDKASPDAWDEEKDRWRYAHPLVYASRERNRGENMFEDDELVLLLEVENP